MYTLRFALGMDSAQTWKRTGFVFSTRNPVHLRCLDASSSNQRRLLCVCPSSSRRAPTTVAAEDSVCSNGLPGIEAEMVCCDAACGVCGGATCGNRPGLTGAGEDGIKRVLLATCSYRVVGATFVIPPIEDRNSRHVSPSSPDANRKISSRKCVKFGRNMETVRTHNPTRFNTTRALTCFCLLLCVIVPSRRLLRERDRNGRRAVLRQGLRSLRRRPPCSGAVHVPQRHRRVRQRRHMLRRGLRAVRRRRLRRGPWHQRGVR